VLLKNSYNEARKGSKLEPKRRGPYTVVSRPTPSTAVITSPRGQSLINIERLRTLASREVRGVAPVGVRAGH
jgi:hypothetical protein